MLVRLKIRRYVLRGEKRFDGPIGTVDAERPLRGFELDEMFLVARALESQRIEPACERPPRMNRAARSIERGASALGFKFQYGTAANGITGDRFAGADTCGAGEAKNVVRRKRDDLVMTASSALVAEVGKFALPGFFNRHSVRRATKLHSASSTLAGERCATQEGAPSPGTRPALSQAGQGEGLKPQRASLPKALLL